MACLVLVDKAGLALPKSCLQDFGGGRGMFLRLGYVA